MAVNKIVCLNTQKMKASVLFLILDDDVFILLTAI